VKRGRRLAGRLTVAATLLVALALLIPPPPAMLAATAACDEPNDTVGQACPLSGDGAAVGTLSGPEDVDTYRFTALASGARARIELAEAPPGYRARLVDWRGRTVAEAIQLDGPDPGTGEVEVPAPGAYYLLVDLPAPGQVEPGRPYRVGLQMTYRQAPPRMVLDLPATGEGPATGAADRPDADSAGYSLATPRGGSPSTGVAVSRGLRMPDGGELGDFTLAADVRFERANGPAAFTARFRYQAEAGGGTGYLLSVDPFASQVRLSAFDSGRRRDLKPWAVHPAAGAGSATMRLVIRAIGPDLAIHLDGQEVVRVADDRYGSGLVALGAVTWSEPIAVTFENILVTTPS
jgi:hypothetical protein